MKTVFVDVDTQIDFLFPAGALYVPGSEKLLPAIARLNQYAASKGIALISTTDAHSENDPEFHDWPPHCVAGTTGQLKPPEALLERRTVLPAAPGAPIELADQVVVEKQKLDVFSNPNFNALLDRLGASNYVVYGVATDYCIRCAVTGLLATGKPVTLVTDAIAGVNPEDGARALAQFTAQGGQLATVDEVTR
ncbi:MAG TPA: isochorismatase family cysteine hydrolase [Bryobacteraceae bacterium]|nr:isochorismatase family cysteine hydrolase [Bryobacteraceae bacterium]